MPNLRVRIVVLMHKILFLFLFLSVTGSAAAFQQSDSLRAELDEVIVTGYEGSRSILETPASVSAVKAQQLHLFDEASLLSGINTLPGVRMEERAAGSYRISVRGSSLRSPFGVRNVKIYRNGVPLTEPTGSTFLNLLDLSSVRTVEVIKGPAGSMYGAGNGGVLLLNSFPEAGMNRFEAETGTGSFGEFYYAGNYVQKLDNGQLQYRYARRNSDGFREQNFFNQHTAEVNGRFFISQKSFLEITGLYTNLDYGIPGGLTEAELKADPRQARPGAAAQESGIKQESLILGATLNREISPGLVAVNSVFASMSSFDNPYLFDYKKDSRKSGGIRSRLLYRTNIAQMPAKFVAGTEIQLGETAARNYDNNAGRVSALNFDDEIQIKSAIVFGSAEFDLKHDFYLTFGAGFNMLGYHFDRLFTSVTDDFTGLSKKTFNPQFIPRAGLAKKISKSVTLHGSVSFGFSPPTVEEVRTNEGSLNLGLSPEKGINYEAGVRGNMLQNRINFDAVFFYLRLNNAIVQQMTQRGTPVFRNAGSADQFGFELATGFLILNRPGDFISGLELTNALTVNRFNFDNYETSGGDFSGNELTGTAPVTSSTVLTLNTSAGFYTGVSHYFSDKMPLDDANTVYSKSYNLAKWTIGYKHSFGNGLGAELKYTLDNLFNEEYSLGYDINAFGGRYYQPAAGRNYFAGLKLYYDF